MPLDAAILNQQIHEFNDFKRIIRPYIDIEGEDLVHQHISNDQFEKIAGINEAFDWPNEENWVDWRQALRQSFAYTQLTPTTIEILQENNLGWLLGAPYFIHASRDDPNLVAYSPERNDRLRSDKTQKIRIGRLLQNELGINNDALVRRITNAGRLSEYTFDVHLTGGDIADAYEHCTANSCMNGQNRQWGRDNHPVRVYESPDLALITIKDRVEGRHGTRWTGRALINLREPCVVRAYGNETLQLFFESAGLKLPPNQERHFQHGSLDKCRLRYLFNDDGNPLMPSIDAPYEEIILENPHEEDGNWRLLANASGSIAGLSTVTERVTRGYLLPNEIQTLPEFAPARPASGYNGGGYNEDIVRPFWRNLHHEDLGLAPQLQARRNALVSLCREIDTEGEARAEPAVFQIPWNNRPVEAIVQCHFCGNDLRPGDVIPHPILGALCANEVLIDAIGPDHPGWPRVGDRATGMFTKVPQDWCTETFSENLAHPVMVWQINNNDENWFDNRYKLCQGTEKWIDPVWIKERVIGNGEWYHNSFFYNTAVRGNPYFEVDPDIHSSDIFRASHINYVLNVEEEEGFTPARQDTNPFMISFSAFFEFVVQQCLTRIQVHHQDQDIVIDEFNWFTWFPEVLDHAYQDSVDNFWRGFNNTFRHELRIAINERLAQNA